MYTVSTFNCGNRNTENRFYTSAVDSLPTLILKHTHTRISYCCLLLLDEKNLCLIARVCMCACAIR